MVSRCYCLHLVVWLPTLLRPLRNWMQLGAGWNLWKLSGTSWIWATRISSCWRRICCFCRSCCLKVFKKGGTISPKETGVPSPKKLKTWFEDCWWRRLAGGFRPSPFCSTPGLPTGPGKMLHHWLPLRPFAGKSRNLDPPQNFIFLANLKN